MKKITSFLIILLPALVCLGQMDRNHKEMLASYEVPASVRSSQETNFPNTFVTRWYQYSNLPEPDPRDLYYTSNFKREGTNSFKAYFDQQGNVIARLTFLPAYSIPESIQGKVLANYQRSKIKSAQLIELYDRKMEIYRIRINTDGLLQDLYYDRYAKMLNASRLPVEILSLN